MMRRLLFLLLVSASSAGAACASRCPEPTSPSGPDAGVDPTTVVVTPPDIDGGDAGGYDEPFDLAGGYSSPNCAAACWSLVVNGCAEGRTRLGEDSCYVVCRRAEGTGGRIDFKPACVAIARSKAAVRACGTYRCL